MNPTELAMVGEVINSDLVVAVLDLSHHVCVLRTLAKRPVDLIMNLQETFPLNGVEESVDQHAFIVFAIHELGAQGISFIVIKSINLHQRFPMKVFIIDTQRFGPTKDRDRNRLELLNVQPAAEVFHRADLASMLHEFRLSKRILEKFTKF